MSDTPLLAEAVRHVREVALREVMVMVGRLQPTMAEEFVGDQGAYRVAHRHCRMQVHNEIERMIATEAGRSPGAES